MTLIQFVYFRVNNQSFKTFNQENGGSYSLNQRTSCSKRPDCKVTTVGDCWDKAVDKTFNDKGFIQWASSNKT